MVKATSLGRVALASLLLLVLVSSFVTTTRRPLTQRRQTIAFMAGANPGKHVTIEDSKLLEDYKTASGEILNPYIVLNVARDADRREIRKSFADLSKRYHPDSRRSRDVLPGSCNNEDDVQKEYERIKMSYDILKDPKQRKRYDRNEMLADPGAAMSRAAMSAVSHGVMSVGKGIFSAGAFAINQITQQPKNND